MPADAESVLKRKDAAFVEQSQQLSRWRESTSYCMPCQVYEPGGHNSSSPFIANPDLVNDTAVQALRDLASGMSSAFINPSEPWCHYQPNDSMEKPSQRFVDWLDNATRVTLRTLPAAGFYGRAYEFVKHAGGIGNAAMKTEGVIPGSQSILNCKTLDIGSYAIAENCAGRVDQLWQEMPYTVKQAEQEWPDYAGDWERMDEHKKMTQKEIFIIEVRARDQKEVEAGMGQLMMPFEGTIVHQRLKKVVWRGGWEEFPYQVYRYDRQSTSTPWGTGPGIEALAASRGVNYLDASLSDGIGKQVDPPMVGVDNIRGTLDLRAGGFTMVENLSDAPKPLYQAGNMQAGGLFLDKKENALRRHFHSDLFSFFLNDDRFKTATVALQIASEKLGLFAPFAHRFLNEFVEPVMQRIFMVLLRQGAFGPIPREALVQTRSGWQFLYPKIVQQSRMALALQQMGRQDVRQLLLDITPIAQIAPESLDYINFGAAVKLLGAGTITMPGVLRTDEEVMAIGQARAEAAQKQQQTEMLANFATKNPDHAAAALSGGAAA